MEEQESFRKGRLQKDQRTFPNLTEFRSQCRAVTFPPRLKTSINKIPFSGTSNQDPNTTLPFPFISISQTGESAFLTPIHTKPPKRQNANPRMDDRGEQIPGMGAEVSPPPRPLVITNNNRQPTLVSRHNRSIIH